MEKERSLNAVIADACATRSALGEEFDADDVLADVMAHSEVWRSHAEQLARKSVRRLITARLKAEGGQDMGEPYAQLAFAGFEKAPRNVPFYEGSKVRYISALKATRTHLGAAIKLRDDNIAFCTLRLVEYQRMRDFIEAAGVETFGEAIAKHATQEQAAQ